MPPGERSGHLTELSQPYGPIQTFLAKEQGARYVSVCAVGAQPGLFPLPSSVPEHRLDLRHV